MKNSRKRGSGVRKWIFPIGIIALSVCACREKQAAKPGVIPEQLTVAGRSDNDSLCRAMAVDTLVVIPDTEIEKQLRGLGLVDVAETDTSIAVHLVYATADNFTGQILYSDMRKAFLLPEAARRLADAQRRLKAVRPDLSLIVYDAVRPMAVQQKMWEMVRATDKQVYVSNPANGGGLHNYGAAVDVSLVDSSGRMVEMGSPFDYFGDEARPDKEDELAAQGRITHIALDNRRLLRRVMKEAGFRPLHSEWWHFNLMSREEAKARLNVIL